MITVADLHKHFRVHKRAPGLRATVASLFHRNYETVRAVDGISLKVEAGERVGFLGPNGAGKTTTLKVLSGLLHPTSGRVSVLDMTPGERNVEFLRSITLVMGQKQQLMWDLPPSETYELNRAIYDIPRKRYKETLAGLVDLLDIGDVMSKPTRQLSLGERMKCELTAALLHEPEVLFLDEPTIGLDVDAQATIRKFIHEYNRAKKATILLTSHYMEDVTALCPRVIIIDRGSIIYDGDLRELVAREHPDKLVSFAPPTGSLEHEVESMGTVVHRDDHIITLNVARDRLREVIGWAVQELGVGDLTVTDPPLEDVLRQLFGRGASSQ